MADQAATPTKAYPEPTPAEAHLFYSIIKNLKSGKLEVDWDGVARDCDFKNGSVASVRFGQVKRKLGLTDPTGSPTPRSSAKAGSGVGSGTNKTPSRVTKVTKPKASGRKKGAGRAKKAATPELKDDELKDDEIKDDDSDFSIYNAAANSGVSQEVVDRVVAAAMSHNQPVAPVAPMHEGQSMIQAPAPAEQAQVLPQAFGQVSAPAEYAQAPFDLETTQAPQYMAMPQPRRVSSDSMHKAVRPEEDEGGFFEDVFRGLAADNEPIDDGFDYFAAAAKNFGGFSNGGNSFN